MKLFQAVVIDGVVASLANRKIVVLVDSSKSTGARTNQKKGHTPLDKARLTDGPNGTWSRFTWSHVGRDGGSNGSKDSRDEGVGDHDE